MWKLHESEASFAHWWRCVILVIHTMTGVGDLFIYLFFEMVTTLGKFSNQISFIHFQVYIMIAFWKRKLKQQ